MCLEDGEIPIYAPPLLCPIDRYFLGPVRPLGSLQDLCSFSMDLSRSIAFDLVRREFDLDCCLKIPNSSTIDRDCFVINHGSTFGDYDET